MNSSNNLTPEQKIDEILKYAVDHAYEVMDSKSFEDPFARAKRQLLSLIQEEKIKELELLKTMYGSFADNTLGKIIVIKAVETSRIDDRLQALKQPKEDTK